MSDQPGGDREEVFCGACGARVEAAARFCTACGEAQAQFAGAASEASGGDTLADARTAVLPTSPPPAPTGEALPGPPPAGVASPPGFAPPPAVAPPPVPVKETRATGVVVVGYVSAFLFPLVGLVIGATQHQRNVHGIRIVVLSIAVMVVSFVATMLLLAAVSSS